MEVSIFHLLNNLYIRLISNYNFIIDKINHSFRGGNGYGSDKNCIQQDLEKMKAREEELDNLISNTGMKEN